MEHSQSWWRSATVDKVLTLQLAVEARALCIDLHATVNRHPEDCGIGNNSNSPRPGCSGHRHGTHSKLHGIPLTASGARCRDEARWEQEPGDIQRGRLLSCGRTTRISMPVRPLEPMGPSIQPTQTTRGEQLSRIRVFSGVAPRALPGDIWNAR